jgi:hypothetical protein
VPYTPPDERIRQEAERATRRLLVGILILTTATALAGGAISLLQHCGG